VWIPAIDKTEVARQLFARGRYADFLAYDAASPERSDSDEVRLYRAAAQTVTNHVDVASATLSSINVSNVERQKYDELRSTIADRKRGVPPPLVFDRMGSVLDSDPNFAPIVSSISAHVDHNN